MRVEIASEQHWYFDVFEVQVCYLWVKTPAFVRGDLFAGSS